MTILLRAKEIAATIASRLSDPQTFVRGWKWKGSTLVTNREPRGLGGAAAASMLHWALAEADQSEDHAILAHDLMRFATGDSSLVDITVFGGWTGIGLAARFAAFGGTRYAQLQKTIREGVAAAVALQLNDSCAVEFSDQYELVAGYAGHYLLLDPAEDVVRERILSTFEWIVAEDDVPRWRLWNRFDSTMTRPTGHIGVSHGVAGILATLCSSCDSARELALIERTGSVLLRYAENVPTGLQWRYEVDNAPVTVGRMAWCHFGLGIAVCLWNAGKLSQRQDFLDAARRTVDFLTARHWREWQLPDYGLCHGIAGSAVLFRYLGREMNNDELLNLSSELFIELVQGFDESLPLGYEALLMGLKCNDPGFLTGSAGIALALLTFAGECDESWLSCLGMTRSRSIARAER